MTMTAEQLEELLGRSLFSDEDSQQLSMLAPSLARRVIAAERLVEAVEDVTHARGMFGVDAANDLEWAMAHLAAAITAYREASK